MRAGANRRLVEVPFRSLSSAADFKFLQRLQQAREGTWNRKAAL